MVNLPLQTHSLSRPFISSSHPFKPSLPPPKFRPFCSPPPNHAAAARSPAKCRRVAAPPGLTARPRTTSRASDALLKEKWLESLTFPFDDGSRGILVPPVVGVEQESGGGGLDSGWVVGVDPDASGALALLKPDGSGVSAQVFDTPHLQVLIGKRLRKRLDARSMVRLLQSFGAPLGTTAYIEQSIPYPKDGKQGWWSGGFTYGLWIGTLVASGFSVVPVASRVWKEHFNLWRGALTKDDCRKVASDLFPSLDSSLKRKKDHGRADALLIAAYGKGLKLHSDSTSSLELETVSQ